MSIVWFHRSRSNRDLAEANGRERVSVGTGVIHFDFDAQARKERWWKEMCWVETIAQGFILIWMDYGSGGDAMADQTGANALVHSLQDVAVIDASVVNQILHTSYVFDLVSNTRVLPIFYYDSWYLRINGLIVSVALSISLLTSILSGFDLGLFLWEESLFLPMLLAKLWRWLRELFRPVLVFWIVSKVKV